MKYIEDKDQVVGGWIASIVVLVWAGVSSFMMYNKIISLDCFIIVATIILVFCLSKVSERI